MIRWTALEWVAFAGLCLLLSYPPYFRGLFFPKEQLVTLIITLAVFMLWWVARWRRGTAVLLQEPLDYAALALVGAYILSLFAAVNPRAAIQEVLKQLNYFLIYWLVSRMGREPGPLRAILNTMLASAVGVAIVGVGVAAGSFQYNGGFDGTRISSTLQYPNSLGAYLTGAFFLALALALHAERRWYRVIYLGAAQLLFHPFVLTYSRGAWLAFPLVASAFLLMLPKGKRLTGLLTFAAVCAPAAAGVLVFLRGISEKNAITVWAGYGASAALAVVFVLLAEWLLTLSAKARIAAVGAAAIAIAAVTAFGASRIGAKPLYLGHGPGEPDGWKHYKELLLGLKRNSEYSLAFEVNAAGPADKQVWQISVVGYNGEGQPLTLFERGDKPSHGWTTHKATFKTGLDTEKVVLELASYPSGTSATFRGVQLDRSGGESRNLSFFWAKALPQSLFDRLIGIGPRQQSAWDRLYFDRDALKIVRDYPFLGTGGGGWASTYFRYQSFGYFTTQVHNHLMQLWVETGTVGVAVLLGLWAAFAYRWWRGYTVATGNGKMLLSGLGATVVALNGHSLIDFNLSLSAVSFYLWSAAGTAAALSSAAVTGQPDSPSSARLTKHTGRRTSVQTLGIACLFAAIVLATGVGGLLAGASYGARGARALTRGDAGQAKALFESAIKWDPWTTSFHLDLAQADEAQAWGSTNASKQKLFANADDHMTRGVRLDRFNPHYNSLYGAFLLRTGRLDQGISAFEKAVELQPFQIRQYEMLANAYFQVGRHLMEQGNKRKALEYLTTLTALPQRIVAQKAREPQNLPSYLSMPEGTAHLALLVGKAHALTLRYDAARSFLALALKDNATQGEAMLWLSVVADREGDMTRKAEMFDKALKLNPALEREHQQILRLFEQF